MTAQEGEAAELQSTPSLQHRIARWIRPSIGDDERALRELISRREELPPLSPGRRGASAGYHSRFYDSAEETTDIVLDLGETQAIDRVAVFSVSAVFQGETIAGYGFPQQFRIEAGRDSSFEQAELLVDSSSTAPVIRPEFPLQAATPGLSARFLRLRVLEHWQRGDGRYLTALGEIMVLSGGAMWRSVRKWRPGPSHHFLTGVSRTLSTARPTWACRSNQHRVQVTVFYPLASECPRPRNGCRWSWQVRPRLRRCG